MRGQGCVRGSVKGVQGVCEGVRAGSLSNF